MKLWIARDMDGELFLYREKPIKNGDLFSMPVDNNMIRLSDDAFPKVTFENSPQKVELKLIEK